MADIAAWEATTGRAHRDRIEDVQVRLDEARAGVAAILGADVDGVVMTHGLADAFERALRIIEWTPPDGVVIVGDGDLEPVAQSLTRVFRGIAAVKVATAGDLDDEQLVAKVATALDHAALLMCPHVTVLGRVLPVARLCALAHERNARVVVDGSVAAGAIPVSIADLGADAYIVAAWTWLLGPEGIGALAASPRSRTAIAREVAAAGPGEFHLPSIVGFARSCGWLSMYVGLEWIHARGIDLTRAAADRLTAIPAVEVLSPVGRTATTLAFRIAGWSAEDALDELGARVFALADAVSEYDAIRIGTGFFNTGDELDRFATAVELLATHTRAALPPRRQLTIIGGDR
jgi:selenocysteine lyase/cysteine desulfurase